jgi:hypothetical protein
MSKKNVRVYAGSPVTILDQDYNMRVTMLGNDYLDDVFGSPDVALAKYNEVLGAMRDGKFGKECRELLCHFIHAAIIHNAYDRDGNKIREIPTAFELRSSLTEGEMMRIFIVFGGALKASLPEQTEKKDTAEEGGSTPQ